MSIDGDTRVITGVVERVRASFTDVADRIPLAAAADLARVALQDAGVAREVLYPSRWPGWQAGQFGLSLSEVRSRRAASSAGALAGAAVLDDEAVLSAVRVVPAVVRERLLGALELTVAGLGRCALPGLDAVLPPPPLPGWVVGIEAGSDERGQALRSAQRFAVVRRGALGAVHAFAVRAAAHPRVAQLVTERSVAVDGGSEEEVLGRPAAARLAVGVAAVHAVMAGAVPASAVDPAAVVGIAIGVAVDLHDAVLPEGLAAARWQWLRREYPWGRTIGAVEVAAGLFGLLEAPGPLGVPALAEDVAALADLGGNGLVAAVPGGLVVATGTPQGVVRVQVEAARQAPPVDVTGWEEVVEVSWRAGYGAASIVGPGDGATVRPEHATPPWPGDYRVRVHAEGRDQAGAPPGSFLIQLWPAPPAPEIVHRRSDRLGYRLRGEPEPDVAVRPDKAYLWLRRTVLSSSATVTVVTGATWDQVMEAFGANAAEPESMLSLLEDAALDPWLTLLDGEDVVVVVEVNSDHGVLASVLERACSTGRAASMAWSEVHPPRLSFADHGHVVASIQPHLAWDDGGPVLAATLDGLDFTDGYLVGMAMAAVHRFTGHAFSVEDWARLEAADVAYWIEA